MTDLTSPQFHGTRAPGLDVGSTLRPHNKLPGKTPNYEGFGNHSKDKVFMTGSEDQAWAWADGGDHHREERTSVLRVTPGPGFREGPAENTAKTAKVEERIDIKPGQQGTLPVNWNQFSPERRNWGAVNHPDDRDITLGHRLDPYSGHRPMTDGPEPLSLENLPEPKVQKPDSTKQGVLF